MQFNPKLAGIFLILAISLVVSTYVAATAAQQVSLPLVQSIEAEASPTPILGVTNSLTSATPATFSSVKTDAILETAIVSRVVDGDTIVLSDGRKVRYIGVDTPETVSPSKPVQCFGKAASDRNKELVLNQTVQLEKDVSETDRYGRLLRYVWLNGTLINTQLVVEGYARASSYPPDIARQTEFRQAESSARDRNVGLWAACPVVKNP